MRESEWCRARERYCPPPCRCPRRGREGSLKRLLSLAVAHSLHLPSSRYAIHMHACLLLVARTVVGSSGVRVRARDCEA